MDCRIELVFVPVTDVDRAKAFYVDRLGFVCDADTQPTPQLRVVQLTPPGSACSITIGPVVVPADSDRARAPRLQLVVTDIDKARAQLVEQGVEAGPVQTLDPRDGGRFVFFEDPDGNGWAVQEIKR